MDRDPLKTFFRAQISDIFFLTLTLKKSMFHKKIVFMPGIVLRVCAQQNAVDCRSFENFRLIMSPGKTIDAKENQMRPCCNTCIEKSVQRVEIYFCIAAGLPFNLLRVINFSWTQYLSKIFKTSAIDCIPLGVQNDIWSYV